jgi:hypothetical protein
MRKATAHFPATATSARTRSNFLHAKLLAAQKASKGRNAFARSAARTRADAAASPQRKKSKQEQAHTVDKEEEEVMSDVGGSAVVAEQPVALASLRTELEQLLQTGRHFARLATGSSRIYNFDNNTAAYQAWTVMFKAEMSNLNLEDVLTTDPGAIMSFKAVSMATDKLQRERQKTVYHMLLICVPTQVRGAITTSLPATEHTGFGAWRALRAYFIGDENAYLQSLENKFQNIKWSDKESFPAFEARYETLLSEMANAGVAKPEHSKKSTLMRAIELSHRKDVRGSHVFDRLNTIAKIAVKEKYHEWLTALRTEAQEIQDSINTATVQDSSHSARDTVSHKRKREDEEEQLQARDVSVAEQAFALTSNPRDSADTQGGQRGNGGGRDRLQFTRANFSQRSHKTLATCRNWSNTGSCSYGDRCKYQHVGPAGGGGGRSSQGGSASASQGGKRQGNCFQFAATGHCSRRACRFSHTNGTRDQQGVGSASGTTSDANAAYYETDAFMIEKVYELKGGHTSAEVSSQNSRTHRVLSDSGDSMHITPKREFIRNMRLLRTPVRIKGAFGKETICRYYGDGEVRVGKHTLRVDNLVYCPELRDTLLSHVLLMRAGHQFNLGKTGGTLTNEGRTFTIPVHYKGNVFNLGDAEEEDCKMEDANATTRSRATVTAVFPPSNKRATVDPPRQHVAPDNQEA